MLDLIIFIFYFIGCLFLVYFFENALIWFSACCSLIILFFIFQLISISLLIILTLIVSILFLVFKIQPLRRYLLSVHLLKQLKPRIPKLSQAEKEILLSGDVGWEGQLFSGDPKWQELKTTSSTVLLTEEEQNFLENQVESLCQLLDINRFTEQEQNLPETVWEYIKKERFWGLTISKDYGGYGFSDLAHAMIITKLASRSYSVAISVMVPNSVGPGELIQHYGTFEQKTYYLPRLARSEEISCFALTSEVAGSDATSIIDKGVVSYGTFENKKILGIYLNWSKRYITLAPVATVMALAFKLFDPEHLLGVANEIGITLAIIPTHLPGITIGKKHHPMNLAFSNGPIQGENVFIPLDAVVGGQEGCGRGWKMIIERFAIGRGISLPALTSGSAQTCLATSSAYALVRQQFRRSIGEFEGVKLKLAEIVGYSYITLAVQKMLLSQISAGNKPAIASAIAKYHLTELNRKLVNSALDIHAGRGVQAGPRNYLLNFYFSIPMNITVEGANILTRSLIIFGQGVVGAHPFLLKELRSLENTDDESLKTFDKIIWQHIYYFSHHFIKTFISGLTGGRLIRIKGKNEQNNLWKKQLTRMSGALLIITDITLLIYGKDLKNREALSARFGDILSFLYLASSVLQFAENHLGNKEEQDVIDWCLAFCLSKIQFAWNDLLANFPCNYLGNFLLKLIFPWGSVYQKPSDQLSFNLANSMLTNSGLRQQLSSFGYCGNNSAAFRVELAMKNILKNQRLLQRLKNEFNFDCFKTEKKIVEKFLHQKIEEGVFTNLDSANLLAMLTSCQEAIAVDVFEN